MGGVCGTAASARVASSPSPAGSEAPREDLSKQPASAVLVRGQQKTLRTKGILTEQYTMKEELGEGAFGIVSKVEHNKSRRMMLACKAMNRPPMQAAADGTLTTPNSWKMALAEVELWSEVSFPYHPSILQLIEVIEGPNGSFLSLITELMEGGELFDVLDHVKFSEQTVRMCTVQVASALAHLHLRHRVAHLDLKPSNILARSHDITNPGCIKLADYGLARRFMHRSVPQFDVHCGTLEYFAPELCACMSSRKRAEKHPLPKGSAPSRLGPNRAPPPEVDSAQVSKFGVEVDMWALGCVIFEMLCGVPPFFSNDDAEQVLLIEQHELVFPPDAACHLSELSMGLVRLLLHPDRKLRLRVEETLRHPWLNTVEDESYRALMLRSLPVSVGERRRETAAARSRRRLRGAGRAVMAVRRLSEGHLSSDVFAQALCAMEGGPSPAPGGAGQPRLEVEWHDDQSFPGSPGLNSPALTASPGSVHAPTPAPQVVPLQNLTPALQRITSQSRLVGESHVDAASVSPALQRPIAQDEALEEVLSPARNGLASSKHSNYSLVSYDSNIMGPRPI